MLVRELITRLGFKVDQAAIDRADRGVKNVKDSAERMTGALRSAALAFGGFTAVQSLVRVADTMQSIEARIKALPQTVGSAGAAFDEVADRAAAAGMSIEAYGALYTRVGNAAKDYISTQEDLLGITDTISKALVVGGSSAQEASAVMLQLSQALASGVLQGDEFRSMAEAAPQYLDQLSQAMNIPREQMKKMASDGKLTSREVIEATRKMAGYFEDRFEEMPMTVGRAVTVVSARFSKMINRMNRESGAIPRIADFIVRAFDRVEDGIGSLIDKLGGFERAVRLAGIAIVVAFGAQAIKVLAAFRTASLAALWPYIRMAAILTAVTLALEDLYVWIQGGESVIGDALGPWSDYRDTAQKVWDLVKELGPTFGTLAEFVGIATGAFIALQVAVGIFNAVLAITPIGWILIGIAALAAAGLMLVANWQAVKDWFSGLFAWLAQKFEWLVSKLGFIGTLAKGVFNPIGAAMDIAGGGAGKVTPSQMTSQGQGRGAGAVTANTTVNVTVPQGTPAAQQKVIKQSAQAAFGKPSNALARDIATRGR